MANSVFLWNMLFLPLPVKLAAVFLLLLCYVVNNIAPGAGKKLPRKLKLLRGGCNLLLSAAICTIVQMTIYAAGWPYMVFSFPLPIWIGNIAANVAVLMLLLANGLVRLFFSSSQIGLIQRLLLIFLWWLPPVNIVVFALVYRTAYGEYRLSLQRHERNMQRHQQQICATRYPLLLVHGIFFRDWRHFNYWGRIPQELEQNGAVIHYGHQQSSESVEQSAEELKQCILRIVEDSGCEKVNIIAHSKGGLDSRYAIAALGMDKYVASLTTVNTPHRGCRFAGKALDNIPDHLVEYISRQYNTLFSRLGDKHPDFYSGVSELTEEKCAELNRRLPDCAGVMYQSVGSRMAAAGSAVFPLNISYSIIHALDGANDGLVAISSMPWGEFTLVEPAGKRGISHADMVDLMRKDIPGLDICEFYVELVRGLKNRGL